MAVANIVIDVEKQDSSQDQHSQLSANTLATRGDGRPESKEELKRVYNFSKFSRYFQVDVTTRNADVLLLACCLISGLTDSAIYDAYGTFVSMQTGNTIFVGLGGSNDKTTYKPYGWVKSFTSIACFLMGSLFFSRLSRFLGPLRRTTLVSSFMLQAFLILLTAAIIEANLIQGKLDDIPNDIDWKQEIAIGLLSFQSAGQIVGSRALSLSEIPTVVVTSVLCDFASDPEIIRPLAANVKRNRRALAFMGILAGAVAGGWLSRVTGQLQTALWVAGGIKAAVVVAWICWPKTSPTQTLD